jgi:hypothetical protein
VKFSAQLSPLFLSLRCTFGRRAAEWGKLRVYKVLFLKIIYNLKIDYFRARNTPQVVKQRIASVILTCVVVHVLHYHLNSCHLGLSFWPLNKCAESAVVQVWSVAFSAAICVLLTALLFLGPLVQLVKEFDPVEDIPDFKSLITWRNLIIVRCSE